MGFIYAEKSGKCVGRIQFLRSNGLDFYKVNQKKKNSKGKGRKDSKEILYNTKPTKFQYIITLLNQKSES